MVWVAEDDFESYTIGADLAGTGGGSGWTSNWSRLAGVGTFHVESAPGGGKAAFTDGGAPEYIRSYTALTSGILQWRMRAAVTNPDDNVAVKLRSGANGKCFVRFGPTGNIEIWNNGTYDSLGAYSANTWYTITLEVISTTAYRAKVDAGSYSANKTPDGGSFTSLDGFAMDMSSGVALSSLYVDDIGPEAAAPPITDAPELIRTVHSGTRFR